MSDPAGKRWAQFQQRRDWLQSQLEIYSFALRRIAQEYGGEPVGEIAQDALDAALERVPPPPRESELDCLRSQLVRALGEGVRLREAWVRRGHGYGCAMHPCNCGLKALLEASPLAEKAGEVIQAAAKWHESFAEISRLDPSLNLLDELDDSDKEAARLIRAVDAYLSELQSQPPPEEAL